MSVKVAGVERALAYTLGPCAVEPVAMYPAMVAGNTISVEICALVLPHYSPMLGSDKPYTNLFRCNLHTLPRVFAHQK